MKSYLADTNIFLRLYLGDNKEQCKKVEFYLQMASDKKIIIEIINETMFEIEFMLRKQYKIDRKTIAIWLTGIITTDYLVIDDRLIWLDILRIYEKVTIDLPDIFLFVKAEIERAEILSFDKDFEKLKKFSKEQV